MKFSVLKAVTFGARNTRPYSKSRLLGITFKAKTCCFKMVSKLEDRCKRFGNRMHLEQQPSGLDLHPMRR
jgi:hypothetical protein